MTDYELSSGDISAHLGQWHYANSNPSYMSEVSSFVEFGSLSTIGTLNSVDGVYGQVVAKKLGNGTVSLTGTSNVYPYLSSTVEIEISNNPPAAPTS